MEAKMEALEDKMAELQLTKEEVNAWWNQRPVLGTVVEGTN